jgi:lysophospholipase L1-like esterase
MTEHTIVFGRVVAQAAETGILLAFCSCLACSSNDDATPVQTGGTAGGQSGTNASTNTSSGGGVGTVGSGTGGTASINSSTARGSGGTSSSASHSGGASISSGGSASASGGASARTGSSAVGSGGAHDNSGGTKGGGSGGSSSSSTGGTAGHGTLGNVTGNGGGPDGTGGHSAGSSNSSTGGTSVIGGSTDHGNGGLSGVEGGGRGASVSTGSSGASGGGSSTPGNFDPCPSTGDCKILPFGDSITAGAGAEPGDNGGYRVELFTKAVNDNKHLTFVGSLTSGPTTVAGKTFPKNHEGHIGYKIDQISSLATTSQALKDSPQIVLLFIGTNDEGYASSQAGASDRLGTLVDKIVTALPNSLLVVSTIYPFPGCKDTNYTTTQCAANVATYDAAIPDVIKQRTDKGKHVILVDMSTPPTGALSTDGVHPNDTVGYPWMGDTWYTAIKSYLH